MVVAILVNRFAPSSRGLKRADPSTLSLATSESQTNEETSYRTLEDASMRSTSRQKALIGHRRKPFRAMACLTSLASDINIISDWFFYYETLQNDRKYRSQHREGVFLIPPFLLNMVFISSIIGTIMWLLLATDGRIITPILRRLGFDKLSMGFLLFLCVVLEDLPQVILTFLVEDYYEQDMLLSNVAVWNCTASLYDTLIKIAEAYDERHDLVETGAWCKHSVVAHKDAATSVVVLSSDASVQHGRSSSRRRASGATDLMAPTSLPRLQFLTASLDTSIRLWTCTESPIVHGVHETVCRRVFQGHLRGVTCLTLFDEDGAFMYLKERGPFFFSGCANGTVNMWSSNSVVCLRRYTVLHTDVTGIGVINSEYLVVGYGDKTCRLWDIASGSCLAIFRGHKGSVTCLCSMEDGSTFVSGSDDRSLCLWDVRSVVQNPRFPGNTSNDDETCGRSGDSSIGSSREINKTVTNTGVEKKQASDNIETDLSDVSSKSSTCQRTKFENTPPLELSRCAKTFSGHSKTVLCVTCIEPGAVFASGSKDRKIRIWSATTGVCLNIFSGHESAVTSIAPLDSITLLSGSVDKSVKAWDCMSASCLRTYTGHEDTVTSISVAEDSFVTTSDDGTAKLWVVTAVEDRPASFDLLDVNDGLCRGLDPV